MAGSGQAGGMATPMTQNNLSPAQISSGLQERTMSGIPTGEITSGGFVGPTGGANGGGVAGPMGTSAPNNPFGLSQQEMIDMANRGIGGPVIPASQVGPQTSGQQAMGGKGGGVQQQQSTGPTSMFQPQQQAMNSPQYQQLLQQRQQIGMSGGDVSGIESQLNQIMSQPQQPQNVFQQSASGITNAMQGAQRAMNYQPMNVQAGMYNAQNAGARGYNAQNAAAMGFNAADVASRGYNAAQTGSTGYNAATGQAQGYNAAQAQRQGNINAERVNAGQIASTDLSTYMNPYTNQVVDTSLKDIERSRQIAANETAAAATKAGAFGGSRQAIMEAESDRNYLDQAARTAANLRQSGFQNAQQMAGQDIATQMQAGLANQQAGLQAQTTNANLGQQINLANQSAQNTARQFGAGATNQMTSQNLGAQNQASQFGAGAQNQASLANQAALNQAGQFGANAYNQAAQQASAQQQAANQFGASAYNQANQFNAGAQNAASQFGAGAQNQAMLANALAANQAGQFNVNQFMQAQQANQNAGLTANQQRLGGASQLGSLANLGFGMGRDIQDQQMLQGAMQQQLQQQLIDAAKGQYAGYQGAPAQSLSLLLQAMGVAPTPTSTTQTKNPGFFDYLTLGLASM
jgi:hypothetical protein